MGSDPVSVILLTGSRGSGKSRVGAVVAAGLNRTFIDLDDVALAMTGLDSVTEVFDRVGEHAWRQAEAAALAESLKQANAVIATGGGVACIDPPRSVLQRARTDGVATTVWLRCSPDVLVARLAAQPGDRPSLTGADATEEAAEVAKEREDLYASSADYEVDANGSVSVVAQDILCLIG